MGRRAAINGVRRAAIEGVRRGLCYHGLSSSHDGEVGTVSTTMGQRFECKETGAQYMVTKAGAGDLTCVAAVDGGPNALGKRYTCGTCGATVLCIKAGTGVVTCDGAPMGLLAAKALPSSD